LANALADSRYKIVDCLGFVFAVAMIVGTLMYLIEGGENGFTSIPRSIYWAIVTITTVGYGDIAPHTVLGQSLAALLMLMGYAIIAVPTGIVPAEIATAQMDRKYREYFKHEERVCGVCKFASNTKSAKYCQECGENLHD
jgi:voltage-gated potassium channel